MQFTYKRSVFSFFEIYYPKLLLYCILISCVLTFLSRTTSDYFLFLMVMFCFYFIAFAIVAAIDLILAALISSLLGKQTARTITLSVDENGYSELCGDNSLSLAWSDVKKIYYRKRYLCVRDKKKAFYTPRSRIGDENFEKLLDYVKQHDIRLSNR